MASKKFPETIYVTRENEGTSDAYLNIREGNVTEQNFDTDTTTVAVYKLVEVGEVTVTRTFTSKPRRRK